MIAERFWRHTDPTSTIPSSPNLVQSDDTTITHHTPSTSANSLASSLTHFFSSVIISFVTGTLETCSPSCARDERMKIASSGSSCNVICELLPILRVGDGDDGTGVEFLEEQFELIVTEVNFSLSPAASWTMSRSFDHECFEVLKRTLEI